MNCKSMELKEKSRKENEIYSSLPLVTEHAHTKQYYVLFQYTHGPKYRSEGSGAGGTGVRIRK